NSSGNTINVGHGKVAIQDSGIVTVDGTQAATLKLVSFNNQSQLQKEGLDRFVWNGSPNGVQDVSDPQLKSETLERSNVNAIDEMVHLMSAYREFEGVQKALKTLLSDLNSKLVGELGKLS